MDCVHFFFKTHGAPDIMSVRGQNVGPLDIPNWSNYLFIILHYR